VLFLLFVLNRPLGYQSTKESVSCTPYKCVFASDSINLLGYRITNGQLQPDTERVKPEILQLPNPVNAEALLRIICMFA